ncbi:MAG: hypothetical protein ACI86H_002647, partial [bacterium]
MESDDKVLKSYINKVLILQNEKKDIVSEEDLKQIAHELGATESDLEKIEL